MHTVAPSGHLQDVCPAAGQLRAALSLVSEANRYHIPDVTLA